MFKQGNQMLTKHKVVMCLNIYHDMMGQFRQRQVSRQNRVNLGQNEVG
jgi:hypothetical protein